MKQNAHRRRMTILLVLLLILISVGVSVFGAGSFITGGYLVGAESIYSGGIATGESNFRIFDPDKGSLNVILVVELVIAVSVFTVLVMLAKSYRDEIARRRFGRGT